MSYPFCLEVDLKYKLQAQTKGSLAVLQINQNDPDFLF